MNNVERIALIASFAKKSRRSFGRTALMKFAYFLQTLRGVPLEYSFSLHSYGPFDSDVLADLDSAESFGAVTSRVSIYPGGYGYEIKEGAQSKQAYPEAKAFLHKYAKDIDWVIENFGDLSSSQLELVSTIIFIDREFSEGRNKSSHRLIVERVHEVKPHFSEVAIGKQLEKLKTQGVLRCA